MGTCSNRPAGGLGLEVGATARDHLAVDYEVMAVDVGPFVGRQEQRSRGDVMGQAAPMQRRGLGRSRVSLSILACAWAGSRPADACEPPKKIGVAMVPSEMQFTVTPYWPSSMPAISVARFTPALAIEYR